MAGLDAETRALINAMLQQFSHALQSNTEVTERLTNGIVNHVLEVATRTFPAEGFIIVNYGATAGSAWIHNHGNNLVTVAAGMASGVMPREGTGVYRISAGTAEAVNIGARTCAFYGTPGDVISYQVFTKGGISGMALLSVDGGTP